MNNNFAATEYVETDARLIELCRNWQRCDMLAIDTEFVRERTLYPRLGLIQVCDGVGVYLIDPLPIRDLSPFAALLADQSIVKVLHACGEDLEVFRCHLDVVPAPLFDTQIAATFTGLAINPGYGKLVELLLGKVLAKEHARTNWLQRPLTDAQQEYAALDVDYLYKIYPLLVDKLSEQGWQEACAEECARFVSERLKVTPAALQYRDIKNSWLLNSEELAILQELANWRNSEAARRDLPLGFVCKDEMLILLAQRQPQSMHDLRQLSGLPPALVKRYAAKLLELVEHGKSWPQTSRPAKLKRLVDYAGYKPALKQLKDVALAAAEKSQLPVELVASKRLLNDFLSYIWKWDAEERAARGEPAITIGWRQPLFAAVCQALIDKVSNSE
ncbi:ribonuclease D [Corallincola spongiicola]|uniref:Ribonuclease D n=1 Tax=Corallincola spongiicola TaxID=2520508 RepID=A0ABY1WV18_9GAMM|nr:ribonuclease D [Corallincola spongiicola]TAA48609.1 ribonuclease D [Corallincola spongiicola]